jgi:hypothetical protein
VLLFPTWQESGRATGMKAIVWKAWIFIPVCNAVVTKVYCNVLQVVIQVEIIRVTLWEAALAANNGYSNIQTEPYPIMRPLDSFPGLHYHVEISII